MTLSAIELNDKAWELFLAVLGAYLGAWFSKMLDAQKKKTPKRPAKHFTRS